MKRASNKALSTLCGHCVNNLFHIPSQGAGNPFTITSPSNPSLVSFASPERGPTQWLYMND